MKVIIAGGRNERLGPKRLAILFDLMDDICEVVSGCASGVDSDAIDWAKKHDIPYKEFPANWNDLSHPEAIIKINKYGKKYDASAGPRRNEEMAKYADAVILFKGGSGTESMFKLAQKYKLKIYDYRTIK